MAKTISDSTIIWNFLNKEFTDDNSVIYLYVCGNVRSPITAIEKVKKITMPLFSPPMTEHFVSTVIKGFLDMKKELYKQGKIKVRPIY